MKAVRFNTIFEEKFDDDYKDIMNHIANYIKVLDWNYG